MPIMYSIHGHPSAHTFSVLMKYLIFASVLAVVTVKNVNKFGAVYIMMICVSVQCSMAIKLKLKEFEDGYDQDRKNPKLQIGST